MAKSIFAGKNYFWQDGFFHGNNRFLPPSGKNLPTLDTLPHKSVRIQWEDTLESGNLFNANAIASSYTIGETWSNI